MLGLYYVESWESDTIKNMQIEWVRDSHLISPFLTMKDSTPLSIWLRWDIFFGGSKKFPF